MSRNLRFISVGLLNENSLMNFSIVLLVRIRIISGSLLVIFFNMEDIYLNIFIKFLTLIILIIEGLL
jgi:hypothetical protein